MVVVGGGGRGGDGSSEKTQDASVWPPASPTHSSLIYGLVKPAGSGGVRCAGNKKLAHSQT